MVAVGAGTSRSKDLYEGMVLRAGVVPEGRGGRHFDLGPGQASRDT